MQRLRLLGDSVQASNVSPRLNVFHMNFLWGLLTIACLPWYSQPLLNVCPTWK